MSFETGCDTYPKGTLCAVSGYSLVPNRTSGFDPNRTFDLPWSLAKRFAEAKPAKIYNLLDRPGLRPVLRFKLSIGNTPMIEEGTRAPFKGWETVRDALCCFRARSNLQRIDA